MIWQPSSVTKQNIGMLCKPPWSSPSVIIDYLLQICNKYSKMDGFLLELLVGQLGHVSRVVLQGKTFMQWMFELLTGV